MYRSSRLQYAPGYLQPDAEYNGPYCDPQWASIPETCSSDPEVDRQWHEALYCGWFNGYNAYHIATQGMLKTQQYVDNHGGDHDIDLVACVTTTLLYKNGITQCQIYWDNLFILYFNGYYLTHSEAKIYEAAEKAVGLRFANFDAERDCN